MRCGGAGWKGPASLPSAGRPLGWPPDRNRLLPRLGGAMPVVLLAPGEAGRRRPCHGDQHEQARGWDEQFLHGLLPVRRACSPGGIAGVWYSSAKPGVNFRVNLERGIREGCVSAQTELDTTEELADRFRQLRERAGLTKTSLARPRYTVSYV